MVLSSYLITSNRGVARGGARGARAPRNLADQLTLLEPGWADFAPHTTVSLPGFKKLSTPLHRICLLRMNVASSGNFCNNLHARKGLTYLGTY